MADNGRKPELVEVRWHGRARQGVITASEMLAGAALADNKYFYSFPDFGAERAGAPVRAFTRISNVPIRHHCTITEPDVVVVLDPTLLGIVDFVSGLKPGGTLLLNSSLTPQQVRAKLGIKEARVLTVNATRIALDTIGRNIPNTPMLGALLRAVPVVSPEAALQEVRDRLGSKVSEKIVAGNVAAFQRSYQEIEEG
ncbi:MAG: 2-oxoacid:acceptor oxidoreductase family protein [Chloroflexi bacterium]|nr:2-oxoacid:acceptor oxidoreductase family protein [Chloroflexota bacterium]